MQKSRHARFYSQAIILVLAAASLVAGFGAAAKAIADDNGWMNEADMRGIFAGITLEGRYGNGRPFSERYDRDGRIAYSERGHVVGGRWSLENGAFCTIYDRDPSGGCYRVKRVATNCYEFYFVARNEEQARYDPRAPSWTARGSVAGQPGSCAEESTV